MNFSDFIFDISYCILRQHALREMGGSTSKQADKPKSTPLNREQVW